MSVKLECDRCAAQEKTSGAMLLTGTCGPGIPVARPELPDGWRRPRLPAEDGSAWERELCPACTSDLLRFMAGQPVIDTPLPDLGTGAQPDQICPDCGHLRHSRKCPDPVSEKGSCGCLSLTPRNKMKELGIDD